MKDEFTTKMHAELLGWSQEDAMLIESFAQIRKGWIKMTSAKNMGSL